MVVGGGAVGVSGGGGGGVGGDGGDDDGDDDGGGDDDDDDDDGVWLVLCALPRGGASGGGSTRPWQHSRLSSRASTLALVFACVPQEAPRRPPGGPQEAPRRPPGGPGGAQEDPRRRPGGSQEAPGGPQEATGRQRRQPGSQRLLITRLASTPTKEWSLESAQDYFIGQRIKDCMSRCNSRAVSCAVAQSSHAAAIMMMMMMMTMMVMMTMMMIPHRAGAQLSFGLQQRPRASEEHVPGHPHQHHVCIELRGSAIQPIINYTSSADCSPWT